MTRPPVVLLQLQSEFRGPKVSFINNRVTMSVSQVRQNFKEECEAEINRQINMEFYASFVYLSMVSGVVMVVTFKSTCN